MIVISVIVMSATRARLATISVALARAAVLGPICMLAFVDAIALTMRSTLMFVVPVQSNYRQLLSRGRQ